MALNLLGKKSNTDLSGGLEPDTTQVAESGAGAPSESLDLSSKKAKKGRKAKAAGTDAEGRPDLSKLKKKELLEILVAQGEEIDALRSQVVTLQAQLAEREFRMQNVGSIAQASLQVTEIFQEAEKAAKIYLENIRRRYV